MDTGFAVVTNRRISFLGQRYTKVVYFNHLVDWEPDFSTRTLTIHCETSSQSFGIFFGSAVDLVTYLQLALSDFAGNRNELIVQWEKDIQDHKKVEPMLKKGKVPPTSQPVEELQGHPRQQDTASVGTTALLG